MALALNEILNNLMITFEQNLEMMFSFSSMFLVNSNLHMAGT